LSLHALEEIHQIAVRNLHAFGPARRTRGEDHVCQVIGRDRARQF